MFIRFHKKILNLDVVSFLYLTKEGNIRLVDKNGDDYSFYTCTSITDGEEAYKYLSKLIGAKE